MDPAASHLLGELIGGRSVASLATLHEGLPFASMVPYAIWHDAASDRLLFVTHVSRLSAHTRDMLETPQVCLLITAPEATGDSEAAKSAFISRQPMGRMARAEEIGMLVVYLASDEAAFVTGQTFVIDGGWSI
jgi:hypothetical protein